MTARLDLPAPEPGRDMLIITVYGTPAPQGSKRAIVGRSGKVALIESSKDRVRSWRQAVLEEARARMAGMSPYTGPLVVEMVFYLARPKGHFGTGRNADVLKASAPRYPAKAPDLSKLIRATEDALTDAAAWADDSLVVQASAAKRWADTRPPGAFITVRELERAAARAHAPAPGVSYRTFADMAKGHDDE